MERIVKKIDNNFTNNINTSESFFNVMINIIFRYYLNIIENSESEISLYYIRGFDNIIDILSFHKKIKIEYDVIEKVSLMGSFGKKTLLRRFSLYFSISFLKVK